MARTDRSAIAHDPLTRTLILATVGFVVGYLAPVPFPGLYFERPWPPFGGVYVGLALPTIAGLVLDRAGRVEPTTRTWILTGLLLLGVLSWAWASTAFLVVSDRRADGAVPIVMLFVMAMIPGLGYWAWSFSKGRMKWRSLAIAAARTLLTAGFLYLLLMAVLWVQIIASQRGP
jgi:hypothetical protein